MSTRPVRTRKPPNRLTTLAPKANKNTQVVVENNKPEANKNTQVVVNNNKTKANKNTQVVVKNNKPIKSPKTPSNFKKHIFYKYYIINRLKSKNEEKYRILAKIYSILPAEGMIRGLTNSIKNSKMSLDTILERQADKIKNKVKILKNVDTTFKLEGDDLIDFSLLIYLDMYHDSSAKTTFIEFLNSGIPTTFLNVKSIDYKPTTLIRNMIKVGVFGKPERKKEANINSGNIKPITKFESILKNNYIKLFDIEDVITIRPNVKLSDYIRDNVTLPVSIDQESSSKIVTRIIEQSSGTRRNTKNRMKTKKKEYKFPPLLTLANLIDSGVGMVGATFLGEIERIFDHKRGFAPRAKYIFGVEKFKFHNSNITIKGDDNNYGKYEIILNDNKPFAAGATKDQAKNSNDKFVKISKFCGDFLQILATASIQRHPGEDCVIASGDAMMGTVCLFVQTRLIKDTKPKLMFDMSIDGSGKNLLLFGLKKYIKSGKVKNNNLNISQITNETMMDGPTSSVRQPTPRIQSRSVQKVKTLAIRQRTPQNKPQGAKRKRTPNVNVNVPVAKKMKKTTPARKAAPSRNNTAGMNRAPTRGPAPSRNNTAGMNRPNSNVSQRKRLRSTTGSVGSRVKQIKISASNRSSAAKTNRSPNSVTQSRSGNGKVESITQTKSPESVTRTTSARPATSNSARSNQTRD